MSSHFGSVVPVLSTSGCQLARTLGFSNRQEPEEVEGQAEAQRGKKPLPLNFSRTLKNVPRALPPFYLLFVDFSLVFFSFFLDFFPCFSHTNLYETIDKGTLVFFSSFLKNSLAVGCLFLDYVHLFFLSLLFVSST